MTSGHTNKSHTQQPQTNLWSFIEVIPPAAEWIYQNRTFNSFVAIRMKIFNIGAGKIPDDFQYHPLLSADIRFVSCPGGRTGVHSSFRDMASFEELAEQSQKV